MFAKVKQFVVDKAFYFAFMRYDYDHNNSLNKDELTSMINDAFQLLRIPKQVSWIQMGFLMNVLDSDNNGQISRDEAYNVFGNALQKFGGISGIAKFAGFGKTSKGVVGEQDQYAYIPKEEQSAQGQVELKISGKVNFVPPEDIDESMLQNLPPVGQNLPPQDLQNMQQQNNQQQFNQHHHGGHGGHGHGGHGGYGNYQGQNQQNSWGNNQQQGWTQWGDQQPSKSQGQQNPWEWSSNQ